MNILVTGANGLLGHHVVMELLQRKHTVKIIVRSNNNIFLDRTSVSTFIGNFYDYEQLTNAAQGCDAIIHIAAVTSTDLLYYSDYSKINVEGTAQIVKVADELNINTLVFVSTANTVGFGSEQAFADECLNIEFPFSKSYYAQSKLVAEQLVIEASNKPNRHFVIINPSFMIGAYDVKPSSGKLLIMGYKKAVMLVPKGGKNFVAVQDVAVSICNALVDGKNGDRYLASGENLTFTQYYKLQQQVGQYSQTIIEIPNFVLKIIGLLGDCIRKIGIKTEVCSMNINQLMIREYYSNNKAKAALNLPETILDIAIKEAIDWFKANKLL